MIDRNARVNLINPICFHRNKHNKKKKNISNKASVCNIVTIIQKIQKQIRVCAELAQDTSRDAAHDRSINRLLTNYPVDRPALPRDVTNVHPAKRENVFHRIILPRRIS